MELGYDGNAATVVPEQAPGPKKAPERLEKRRPKPGKRSREILKNAQSAVKTAPTMTAAPKLILGIVVVAVVIIMMLVSHAQLVVVNDQAVALRSELSQLESEATKLKAQYELNYDLQEIETQMLTSGQMSRIQTWQTYVLELSEPDDVEYYQYKGGLGEQVANAARDFAGAVREYF